MAIDVSKEFNREEIYDSLKDEEFDDFSLKNCKNISSDISNRIIICINLPIIKLDRVSKLEAVIMRRLRNFNKPLAIHFPSNDDKTTGIMLFYLENSEDAQNYKNELYGFKLDKSHTITSISYEQYLNFISSSSEDFVIPENNTKFLETAFNYEKEIIGENCVIVEQSSPSADLSIKFGVIRQYENEDFQKYDFDQIDEKIKFISFSPKGTYFCCVYNDSVDIFVGDVNKFNLITRIQQKDIVKIKFSPCESFIVLRKKENIHINTFIYDIITGFFKHCKHYDIANKKFIKFTDDEAFMFCQNSRGYSIMNGEKLQLNTSLSSSNENILTSYLISRYNFVIYVDKKDDLPCNIFIHDLVKNQHISIKSMFDIAGVKFFGERTSKYLAILYKKYKKKSKINVLYSLDVVQLDKKDFPIITYNNIKGSAECFWEPNDGDYFIMKLGYEYSIGKVENDTIVIKETINNNLNHEVLWNPNGRIFALLPSKSVMGGQVEFYDAYSQSCLENHPVFMCNKFSWESTGRFFAMFYNKNKDKENLVIFNQIGVKVLALSKSHIHQFKWRSRHEIALSKEKMENMKKNYKEHIHEFKSNLTTKMLQFTLKQKSIYKDMIINYYQTVYEQGKELMI